MVLGLYEGKLPVRCWCGAFCKNIYTRVVIGFRGFGSFVLVLRVYFPASGVYLVPVPVLFLVFGISVVWFWVYGLFCGFLGII